MPNVWLNFVILGLSSFIGIHFLSRGVTELVGERIINLSPLMVFVVQFSGTFTIHLFTQFKLPISLVQALIGGILGIGLLRESLY
ncbi:inorganic phosphate transporter [Candidatus Bathyarchaeota archaeon]|nr:inorganic phosphate transporter [Candidatus Bathyarchaeota archaeon]